MPSAPPLTVSSATPSRTNLRLPLWWLTVVNVGLGCFAGVELVALLWLIMQPATKTPESDLKPPAAREQHATTPSVSQQGRDATQPESVPAIAPVATRPLFQGASAGPATTDQSGSASAAAQAVASRLSVIGIVAGNPMQAIIEDSKTKKTYFAIMGQRIAEGLLVQEIRQNRVILTLNGETIELSL